MTQTVDLYADDGGIGDPLSVVFLHSLAGNTSQWSAQLEHLRPERRAVALDWRGHGRSGASADGDYSVPAAAADVQGAAGRLGLERFVLVGHSGGGLAALQYAADHPERVAGLLLADPSGDFRKVPAEQMDPLLAALDSEAYAATIGQYWGFILTGADPAVRERVMADLGPRRRRPSSGSSRRHAITTLSPPSGLTAGRYYRSSRRATTNRSACTTSEPASRTRPLPGPATGCTWTSPRSSTASLTGS